MKKNLCKWFKGLHASGKVFVGGVVVLAVGTIVAYIDMPVGLWTMVGSFVLMTLGMSLAIVRAGKERDEWDAVISNGKVNGKGPKMEGGK